MEQVEMIDVLDMENPNDIWAYDEPHPSGGNCRVTMTKRQAAKWMRSYLEGMSPIYETWSDQACFLEWVILHMAQPTGEKDEPDQESETKGTESHPL